MKDSYASRAEIIKWIFALSSIGLIIQTARLQLFDDTYQKIAQQTTINKKIIDPARGIFYDRNDQVLTYNNPVYDLMCTRNLVQEMDTAFFCQLLNIDQSTFLEGLNKNFGRFFSKSIPYTFLKGIDQSTYARFQEHLQEFPGFDIKIRNLRHYPIVHGANVLGYVSEVSKDQIDNADGAYIAGDLIGSRGLEKYYDAQIRGQKGLSLVLKDNRGNDVTSYEGGKLDTAALPGNDIVTTLDFDLQTLGEELLKNKNGSIVAIEPSSGEILAMVSAPSFDPNLLSINQDRGAKFDSLTNDPNNPFLDRTVSAKYPPGSIFKTVVGLIALQEGLTYESKPMTCNGGYRFNEDFYWGCRTHPYPANMAIALQYSCNTYFYQIYRYIIDQYGYNEPQKGLDRMNEYLANFGLGRKLNIDYPFEKKGNMPSSRYYDRQYGSSGWKSPTIISNGIGQGELELTTVQMANLAAIMANYGNYRVPHLIKSYKNSEMEIPAVYRRVNNVGIDSIHFRTIHKGMELAGKSASFPGVKVAGKTGTSQNIGDDHSVYFAYAPADDPQIAIAVYVENAGSGGATARPIASYMIEQYINGDIADNRKGYMEYIKSIQTSIIPEPVVVDTTYVPEIQ